MVRYEIIEISWLLSGEHLVGQGDNCKM